jgi:hypothetical protein
MKKPKRIVLGIGHPWYSEWIDGGFTVLQMTVTPVPQSILARQGKEKLVEFKTEGTGNYNKCRLVLEILK